MNTIKFNDHAYQVQNYNKSTYFNNGTITSTASCSIITSDSDSLTDMADEKIETIQIYNDENLIYTSANLNGHLNSIEEYLTTDRVNVNLSFGFTFEEEEEESEEENESNE